MGGLRALAIIFVVAGLLFWWRDDKVKVVIGTTAIQAEVADTEDERAKGLRDAVHLAANQGMLFVFPHDDRWGIWMKDMHVPIDIVWLDAGKKVVAAKTNVDPASYPAHFEPPHNARYVLELASGAVTRYQIEPGIRAQFDVPLPTK